MDEIDNNQGNGTETGSQESNNGTGTESQGNENRTFTQDTVNEIVEKRLSKERAKFADYDDLKAKAEEYETYKEKAQKADELQAQLDALKAEIMLNALRQKVSQETGVPANLLNANDEAACRQQAEAILNFAKQKPYPKLKDSGEIATVPMTKKEILSIENEKERLKAIEQHIELFK